MHTFDISTMNHSPSQEGGACAEGGTARASTSFSRGRDRGCSSGTTCGTSGACPGGESWGAYCAQPRGPGGAIFKNRWDLMEVMTKHEVLMGMIHQLVYLVYLG